MTPNITLVEKKGKQNCHQNFKICVKCHCQIGEYVILIELFAHSVTIVHLKFYTEIEILLLTVVKYVFHISPSINLPFHPSPPPLATSSIDFYL